MAGSAMTFTYDDAPNGGRITKVICTFLTDSSTGAASGTTARNINGELIKIVTDPGSPAPDANWDVVLTDDNGLNPLAGIQNAASLLARHTTNTEQTYLQMLNADLTPIGIAAFPVVTGLLTVTVANGGNSKAGTITIYVRG